jgi:hypothetical protein
MMEIGDRVGVILKTNNETRKCYFLGYGIYEGKYKLDARYCSKRAVNVLINLDVDLCRFKLDDGDKIYDADCWFMSEERFNAVFVNDEYKEGWKIINVDRKGKRRKI